jgi:GntR family galactonate operon transcriptional repressor
MKNRNEQLVHEIGRKIVIGEIKSGEVLPKIEELSEIYGVSRTVVREAYKGLTALGLVRSTQRSGTMVLPRSSWQWWNDEILQWLLEDENNHDFLLHLTEVRMGLEPMAAALSAQRATDEDRNKITASFQELENSVGNVKAWAKADYDFHQRILESSHNDLIINTVKRLHKALVLSREQTMPIMKDLPESSYDSPTMEVLERHRGIYDAIMDRDEQLAHQKTLELILRVKRLLEKIYENKS